jgi:hypothetical protein
MAPDGHHFEGGSEVLHTLLCDDLRDVRDRASYYDVRPCDEKCR